MEMDSWWLSKAESKEVLKKISKGVIDDELLNILGGKTELADDLNDIHEEYKIELSRTKAKSQQFKNLPFYYLIKKKIRDFSWETVTSNDGKESLVVHCPRQGGRIPSLSTMIIYPQETILWSNSDNFDYAFRDSSFSHDEIDLIKTALQQKPFRTMSEQSLFSLVDTLNRAREQNKITIFSPVCPDYSHIKQADGRFMYTFRSLGSSVGLVGERLIQNLPPLYDLMCKLNIECKVVIGLGDFEGFDKDNLARLGVDEETFMERIESSAKKILSRINVPVKYEFIAGLNGTKNLWEDDIEDCALQIEKASKEEVEKYSMMIDIVASRKGLYDKWFGEKYDLKDHLPVLIRQGAEYALMGKIIAKQYDNPMVVGFDHFKMEPFYSEYSPIPVLYTECIYL